MPAASSVVEPDDTLTFVRAPSTLTVPLTVPLALLMLPPPTLRAVVPLTFTPVPVKLDVMLI